MAIKVSIVTEDPYPGRQEEKALEERLAAIFESMRLIKIELERVSGEIDGLLANTASG